VKGYGPFLGSTLATNRPRVLAAWTGSARRAAPVESNVGPSASLNPSFEGFDVRHNLVYNVA
jgi:hypothetical protein